MLQMIRFEFGKIFNRRIVYAAIIFAGILTGALCQGRGAGAQIALRPEGGYYEGREAVAYDREVAARHEGEITVEKIKEILETYAPDSQDAGFWLVNDTFNTISRFWGEVDGSYNGVSVEEALPEYLDERPLVLGYSAGWVSFLETGMYIMVVMGFLLIIALSPVFSEEYTRGTDALILTSRHGKRKCAWAKVIASYLFTLLTVGVFLVFISISYLAGFGLDGAEGSVQINNHFLFTDVPYFLTYMQTAGYCLVLWLGGSLILTALVLILSALCRSSFITLIAAMACYLIPTLFGQMGVPKWILSLSPIWEFMAEIPVGIPLFSLSGGAEFSFVWVLALFALAAAALSFVLGGKIFAGHQVV